jgi:TonB family protein
MKSARHSTVIGCGLSLLVHVGLVALLTVRPQQSEPSTESAVTITLLPADTEEPQPAPAPANQITPIETKSRGASHLLSRRVAKVSTSFERSAEIAPIRGPDPDEPDEAVETQPAYAAVVSEAVAETLGNPTKAPVIAPDTARALRVYDTFPMLLARAALARAEVLVEVCVSDHGQVSDAVIAQGGMEAIDNTLRTAIRSWRYRPLLVNGAPTPFCHFMRIKYAMN